MKISKVLAISKLKLNNAAIIAIGFNDNAAINAVNPVPIFAPTVRVNGCSNVNISFAASGTTREVVTEEL